MGATSPTQMSMRENDLWIPILLAITNPCAGYSSRDPQWPTTHQNKTNDIQCCLHPECPCASPYCFMRPPRRCRPHNLESAISKMLAQTGTNHLIPRGGGTFPIQHTLQLCMEHSNERFCMVWNIQRRCMGCYALVNARAPTQRRPERWQRRSLHSANFLVKWLSDVSTLGTKKRPWMLGEDLLKKTLIFWQF